MYYLIPSILKWVTLALDMYALSALTQITNQACDFETSKPNKNIEKQVAADEKQQLI